MVGPGAYSDGYAINDEGQVTGHSDSLGGPHAFLYRDGQMVDLNGLIDPTLGITLTDATGINDHGHIVANGGSHAYLLTPVPEPSTWALLSIPFLVLLVWLHRLEISSRRNQRSEVAHNLTRNRCSDSSVHHCAPRRGTPQLGYFTLSCLAN